MAIRGRLWRMLTVLCVVLFLFTILLGQLTRLMLFSSEERLQAIDRTRHFFDITAGRRGNIYDRHGVALALTVPSVEVGLDPKLLGEGDRDRVLDRLATLLQRPREELEEAIAERLRQVPSSRWVRLAENVSENFYQRIREAHLVGVYGNRKFFRTYPQHTVACHVVGFINREGTACCGMEKFADFFLRGQDGWVLSEKDGRRRELCQFRSRGIPCVDGCDIHLTLDLAIQRLAEDELERIDGTFHPQFAVILIAEAETGKLLALACSPNYDPNFFFRAPMDHLRNRAISDCYEPGSVFKIVAVAAGMEEGIITPQSRFNCASDTFSWEGHTYHLPNDHSTFGAMSLTEVLRKSSNRGSAQIAIRLGPEKFYSYVRAFGFGERTGYGFDGEAEGILHPPHQWDNLTITRMPMGHAIAVTPLQMHMAMGVLASGGYLFAPRLVERAGIGEEDGLAEALGQPVIRRRVLGRETVRQMRTMLHNPADGHAGIWAYACKTGTSQKIVDGHYVHDCHVASCSGFFPVQNPKFLVTVVVDSPESHGGTGWGGTYAKPSFIRIVEELSKGYVR